MARPRIIYWGEVLCETDFEGAYLLAKVRPWPYWWLMGAWLFLRIVWRRYDTRRLSIGTAYDVCRVVWRGLTGPVLVKDGKVYTRTKRVA